MKKLMTIAAALTCLMLVTMQSRAQSTPAAPQAKVAPVAQDAQQGALKATVAPQVKEPAAPAMQALQPSTQPARDAAVVPQKADDSQVQSVKIDETTSHGIKPVNADSPKPSTISNIKKDDEVKAPPARKVSPSRE